MDNHTASAVDPIAALPVNSEIELLAREADMPHEIVAKLYSVERAKLERVAKIKTYVPVLAHRRVKAILREQRRA